MRDYYGELARGTGRAEALRQTKLRLMHQPRYASLLLGSVHPGRRLATAGQKCLFTGEPHP